jgi:hypothetical protein
MRDEIAQLRFERPVAEVADMAEHRASWKAVVVSPTQVAVFAIHFILLI